MSALSFTDSDGDSVEFRLAGGWGEEPHAITVESDDDRHSVHLTTEAARKLAEGILAALPPNSERFSAVKVAGVHGIADAERPTVWARFGPLSEPTVVKFTRELNLGEFPPSYLGWTALPVPTPEPGPEPAPADLDALSDLFDVGWKYADAAGLSGQRVKHGLGLVLKRLGVQVAE